MGFLGRLHYLIYTFLYDKSYKYVLLTKMAKYIRIFPFLYVFYKKKCNNRVHHYNVLYPELQMTKERAKELNIKENIEK